MKPYYDDGQVQIYCADCIEGMKEMPGESVDLVLTDPPWMVSREVVIHRSMNPTKYKYVGRDINLDFGEWDHFGNDEDYYEFTKEWLVEAVHLLRPGGHLVTFYDQNKVTPLIAMARGMGCRMRQQLYWLKTNPVPRARKVDFMIALEHACWFTKEPCSKATFNYQLGQQHNYIQAPIPGHTTMEDGSRDHPTQKPLKVLQSWILYLSRPNDLVLDSFMGCGTTLQAAKKLGRRAIGFDISEEYCALAVERCRQGVFDLQV